MRKLNEFKKNEPSLSECEMLKVSGGLYASTSRYTCWSETAGPNCSDTREERTIDQPDGTSTTTITETDH